MADNKKTLKELVQAFTSKLNEIVGGTPAQKFLDAKLEDGTIVQVEGDAVAEGVKLNVVGEDGTVTPAPDAEHTLEDGTKVTTQGGVIVAVKPAEMGGEVPHDEMMKAMEAMAAAVDSINKKVTDLETKVTSYEQKMSAQEKTIADTQTLINQINETVSKIGAMPSADPTVTPTGAVFAQAKSVKEQLEAFKKDLELHRSGKK